MLNKRATLMMMTGVLAVAFAALPVLADDCHIADHRNVIENNFSRAVSVMFNGSGPLVVAAKTKMNIDNPEFDALTSLKVTDAGNSNHTATWSGSVLQKSCRQEVCIKKPDAEGYCSRSENDTIWSSVAKLLTGDTNCKCKKKLPGKTIIKVVVTSDLKLKVYNT